MKDQDRENETIPVHKDRQGLNDIPVDTFMSLTGASLVLEPGFPSTIAGLEELVLQVDHKDRIIFLNTGMAQLLNAPVSSFSRTLVWHQDRPRKRRIPHHHIHPETLTRDE